MRTAYARDVQTTSMHPAPMPSKSQSRASASGNRSLKDAIQYDPARNKNATAANTSFESGERPMPENTCSALAGVPRCVAEAMNPTSAMENGSATMRSSRTAASRPGAPSRASASAMNATAPAGASVVNNASENASNPLVISRSPPG